MVIRCADGLGRGECNALSPGWRPRCLCGEDDSSGRAKTSATSAREWDTVAARERAVQTRGVAPILAEDAALAALRPHRVVARVEYIERVPPRREDCNAPRGLRILLHFTTRIGRVSEIRIRVGAPCGPPRRRCFVVPRYASSSATPHDACAPPYRTPAPQSQIEIVLRMSVEANMGGLVRSRSCARAKRGNVFAADVMIAQLGSCSKPT